MRTRLEWLDLLRGLAALGIVLYHYQTYLGLRHTGYAVVAVDVFFALSGVVLALRYATPIVQGMPALEFFGARLRRLYPMVLITALFIAAMNILGVPSAVECNPWTVLALTPARGDKVAWPADPALWSLWAELAANAVWFAVLKAGRRWVPALGMAATAITILVAVKLDTLNFGWEAGQAFRLASLARALAWFCIGQAIATHAMRLRTAAAVFAGCIAAWAVVSHVFHSGEGVNELFGASCGVALLNLMYRFPAWAAVSTVSRWLGMASFPLYLVHMPAGRLLPSLGGMPHWPAFLAVMGAATVVATLANEAATRWFGKAHRRWSAGARLTNADG